MTRGSVPVSGSDRYSAGLPLLWPRLMVVHGPRLMSWSATLQYTCPPPNPHPVCADVKQLITSASRCCRAINHPQSGSARMERPLLGVNKIDQGGRMVGERRCSPLPITTMISCLVPLKAAVHAHSSSDSSVNTAHSLLSSGPSPAAPFNCLY